MTEKKRKSWTPVRFVVVRPSSDEFTFALVTAEVKDPALEKEDAFFDRMCGAIACWVLGTRDGEQAWLQSSKDFNVGDLSHHLGGPNSRNRLLISFLEKAGIRKMEVEPVCEMSQCRNWTYDTVLVNDQYFDAHLRKTKHEP